MDELVFPPSPSFPLSPFSSNLATQHLVFGNFHRIKLTATLEVCLQTACVCVCTLQYVGGVVYSGTCKYEPLSFPNTSMHLRGDCGC